LAAIKAADGCARFSWIEIMAKKQKGINPELENAIAQMLVAVMSDPMASITDKTKVLDRALKLEAIKLKLSRWMSGVQASVWTMRMIRIRL